VKLNAIAVVLDLVNPVLARGGFHLEVASQRRDSYRLSHESHNFEAHKRAYNAIQPQEYFQVVFLRTRPEQAANAVL
jgi:hypothetical protein